jgi:hypothetical protein
MPPPIDPQTQRAALAGDPEAKRNKHPLHINIPLDVQVLILALAPLWLAIVLFAIAEARP